MSLGLNLDNAVASIWPQFDIILRAVEYMIFYCICLLLDACETADDSLRKRSRTLLITFKLISLLLCEGQHAMDYIKHKSF